jgi:hypothetical protein
LEISPHYPDSGGKITWIHRAGPALPRSQAVREEYARNPSDHDQAFGGPAYLTDISSWIVAGSCNSTVSPALTGAEAIPASRDDRFLEKAE